MCSLELVQSKLFSNADLGLLAKYAMAYWILSALGLTVLSPDQRRHLLQRAAKQRHGIGRRHAVFVHVLDQRDDPRNARRSCPQPVNTEDQSAWICTGLLCCPGVPGTITI